MAKAIPSVRTLTAAAFLKELKALQSATELQKIQRYFKSGEGQYAVGDKFLGVKMGHLFTLAKTFAGMPVKELETLLENPYHEARAGAISIMDKESRNKKATPVLLTPVARRKFDSTGHIEGTHDVYSEIIRRVATSEKVALIDLDKKSQVMYQQFGPEYSKFLFLQLKPGEHPNYPDGKDDNTHFSELGARLVAQLVLQEIKNTIPELAKKMVRPVTK